MLLRPPEPDTELIASVRHEGDWLFAALPERDEAFRALVKARGFTFDWKRWCWVRELQERHGPALDRAAETAHLLLAAGFPVEVKDDVARLILECSYRPEVRRWILRSVAPEYDGWFALEWPRDDDYYAAARRISGSRYARPYVVIPPEQYEAVEDFAERHDFVVSKPARDVIDAAAARRRAALIVDVPLRTAPRPTVAAPAGGIDPDLLDEDDELANDDSAL